MGRDPLYESSAYLVAQTSDVVVRKLLSMSIPSATGKVSDQAIKESIVEESWTRTARDSYAIPTSQTSFRPLYRGVVAWRQQRSRKDLLDAIPRNTDKGAYLRGTAVSQVQQGKAEDVNTVVILASLL